MDSFSGVSDRKLIKLSKQGDKKAFSELVRRHFGIVIYYLANMGVGLEDSQDIAQESFIKAYRKLEQYKPSCSFTGWIVRIARNTFIDNCRKEKRKKMSDSPEKALDYPDKLTPEAMALSNACKSELYGHMNAKEQLIIEMRVFQKMSYSEISELLCTNETSLRVLFHRLILKLRKKLKEEDL